MNKNNKLPSFPILTPEACDLAIRQRTKLLRIVSGEYYKLMEEQFKTILPYLPGKIKNILDIGGGLGGVHISLIKK